MVFGQPYDAAVRLSGLTNFIDTTDNGHVTVGDSEMYWARVAGMPLTVLVQTPAGSGAPDWSSTAAGYGMVSGLVALAAEIGRASGRESVCQSVSIAVVAAAIKKNNHP